MLVSLAAGEIFVRLLVPSTILFGTWYTDGAYTPDSKYGFVPTPNYRGVMSHPDGVFEVPLSLDKHGFRLPVESKADVPNKKDIVIMGGASMLFSYGTPDEKTVAGHIVKKLSFPSRVHTTSFPGLDLNRNFYLYQEKLAPEIHASHVIVGLYYGNRHAAAWNHLKDSFALQPPPPHESLFTLFKGRIVFPTGTVGEALGIWNYRSALLNRTSRFFDNWAPDKIKNPIATAIHWVIPERKTVDPGTSTVANTAPNNNDYTVFKKYIRHLDKKISEQGAKMLVVLLPLEGMIGADAYENIRNAIPSDIQKMDLHNQLREKMQALGGKCWLGGGHYSSLCNELIAQELALWIEGNNNLLTGHK